MTTSNMEHKDTYFPLCLRSRTKQCYALFSTFSMVSRDLHSLWHPSQCLAKVETNLSLSQQSQRDCYIPCTTFIETRSGSVADVAFCTLCPVYVATPAKTTFPLN